jgi:hypothetical protein
VGMQRNFDYRIYRDESDFALLFVSLRIARRSRASFLA